MTTPLQAPPTPKPKQVLLAPPALVIGLVISLVVIALGLLSLIWTPFPFAAQNIANKFAPIGPDHWLGTDQYGRDVASMMMAGAANSILVSLVAVVIGAGIGVPLGALAAAKRGWVDEVVMRFSDFAFAFPALLSAVMITAIYGPGAVNSMIAIGIFNIPVFARVTRGAALSIWPREFIAAARVAGKGKTRITIDHILPNITGILVVQATIQFALAILAEAGLSYLGLGTQPPNPSWGKMLNDAQTLMHLAPTLAIFPGLAIVITVMGLNLLGDGFRDLLDPRIRRQR
ncbi:MAG: ABC transporter permease [Geminicoccales bacterium]